MTKSFHDCLLSSKKINLSERPLRFRDCLLPSKKRKLIWNFGLDIRHQSHSERTIYKMSYSVSLNKISVAIGEETIEILENLTDDEIATFCEGKKWNELSVLEQNKSRIQIYHNIQKLRDEDELEVVPITINSVDYYMDQDDGLYHPDLGDFMGLYVNGTIISC